MRAAVTQLDAAFGARITVDGARFRVWTPGARRVELLLDLDGAQRRQDMNAIGEGFFEAVVDGVLAGARYRYRRDDAPPLPDPASRSQPDGVHGASELVDLAFPWTDAAWSGRAPEEIVIYELHIGTFTEEGTFRAAHQRLDHLAELGVTALEIMPLAAFPGARNWGYDGAFHFAPFAGYGRPSDFQALVDACHARGLAVILDVVTNHFGPEGNAMWTLAPDFFRPDRPTAWAAGHNWDAEPVLRYFDEMAVFWATAYHVDGLRLDAFHAVPDHVRHVHLRRMLDALDRALPQQRRFTVLLESVDNDTSLLEHPSPRLHLCQLNFDFQRAAHALLTGERHGEYSDFDHPEADLARCLRSGFAFLQRYSAYHRRVRGESAAPTSWDQVVSFLQNHDSIGNRYLGQRLDRLVDIERLRAATALLLLHPTIPFLFMGQEWRASTPYHFFVDLPPGLAASVSSGRRRGFRELGPQGEVAFAGDIERPPDCAEEASFRRARLRWSELEEPRSREELAFVRRLLALRRELLLRYDRRVTATSVTQIGGALSVRIEARDGGGAYLLLTNLDDSPAEDRAPLPADAALLFSTSPEPRAPRSTQLYRLQGASSTKRLPSRS
jgi:maltooligosyltrehalose trehalohydrolase